MNKENAREREATDVRHLFGPTHTPDWIWCQSPIRRRDQRPFNRFSSFYYLNYCYHLFSLYFYEWMGIGKRKFLNASSWLDLFTHFEPFLAKKQSYFEILTFRNIFTFFPRTFSNQYLFRH